MWGEENRPATPVAGFDDVNTASEPVIDDAMTATVTHLVRYAVTLDDIRAKAEEYAGCTFDTPADYEQGRKAIQVLEKRRKELKEDSLEYGRRVDAVAKELTRAIEAVEDPLKAKKQAVDDEKARAKREAEEAEKAALEAKVRAEREAEEARLKAEREAEEARLRAEREAPTREGIERNRANAAKWVGEVWLVGGLVTGGMRIESDVARVVHDLTDVSYPAPDGPSPLTRSFIAEIVGMR